MVTYWPHGVKVSEWIMVNHFVSPLLKEAFSVIQFLLVVNLFILFCILCSLLDLNFLAGDLNLDWLNSVSLALTSFHSLPSGFLPRRPYVLLQGNHHVRYLELTIVMWQYIDNCRRKICKIVRETTLFPKTLLPTPNPSKHTKCNKTQ